MNKPNLRVINGGKPWHGIKEEKICCQEDFLEEEGPVIRTEGMPTAMIEGIAIMLNKIEDEIGETEIVDKAFNDIDSTLMNDEYFFRSAHLNDEAKAGALIAWALLKDKIEICDIDGSMDRMAQSIDSESAIDLYNKHINYMHDPEIWPLDKWDGGI